MTDGSPGGTPGGFPGQSQPADLPERSPDAGGGTEVDTGSDLDDRQPEPGDLHIVQKRTWRTWQLVAAVIVAALLGMWINGSTGGASGSSATSGGESKLPPPSESTTTPPSGAHGSSSGSTTTTTAGGAAGATTTTTAGSGGGSAGATTTTTTGGGAPATAAAGPNTVLVPATQQTGNWTSPAFTIAGGTWDIGWAFRCTPPPASGPSFQVFVVANGASPGPTPAVTSTDPQGQSVTPQTSTGSQQIVVQAPPGCLWAVKVTGFSG